MDLLQKRLVKFLLKRMIGPFLATELNIDQLEVQLSAGELCLTDLCLNPQALNVSGSGIKLSDGWIEKVNLKVPYTALLSQSCELTLSGIHLTVDYPLEPDEEDDSETFHSAQMSMSTILPPEGIRTSSGSFIGSISMNRSMMIAQNFLADIQRKDNGEQKVSTPTTPKLPYHSLIDSPALSNASSESSLASQGESGDEGMKMIANLIDKIMAQLKIQVKNLFVYLPTTGSEELIYRLHIPEVQYSDSSISSDRRSGSEIIKSILFRSGIFLSKCTSHDASSPVDETTLAKCPGECLAKIRLGGPENGDFTATLDIFVPNLEIESYFQDFVDIFVVLGKMTSFSSRVLQTSLLANESASHSSFTKLKLHIIETELKIQAMQTTDLLRFHFDNIILKRDANDEIVLSVEKVSGVIYNQSDEKRTQLLSIGQGANQSHCLRGHFLEDELVLNVNSELSATITPDFLQSLPYFFHSTSKSRHNRSAAENEFVFRCNFDQATIRVGNLFFSLNNLQLLLHDPINTVHVRSMTISSADGVQYLRIPDGIRLQSDDIFEPDQQEFASLYKRCARKFHISIPLFLIDFSTDTSALQKLAFEFYQFTIPLSQPSEKPKEHSTAIFVSIGDLELSDSRYRYCLCNSSLVSAAQTLQFSSGNVSISSLNSEIIVSPKDAEAVQRLLFKMDETGYTCELGHLVFRHVQPPLDPFFNHIISFYKLPRPENSSTDNTTKKDIVERTRIKLTEFEVVYSASVGTLRLAIENGLITSHELVDKFTTEITSGSVFLTDGKDSEYAEIIRFFNLQIIHSVVPISDSLTEQNYKIDKFEIEMDRMLIDSCCDSTITLSDLFSIYSDQILEQYDDNAPPTASPVSTFDNVQTTVDDVIDTMHDIDEEVFRARKPSLIQPKPSFGETDLEIQENYFGISGGMPILDSETTSAPVQMKAIDGQESEDEDALLWEQARRLHSLGFYQQQTVRVTANPDNSGLAPIEDYFLLPSEQPVVDSLDNELHKSANRMDFIAAVRCKEIVWKLWDGFDWTINQESYSIKKNSSNIRRSSTKTDLYEPEIEVIFNPDDDSIQFFEHSSRLTESALADHNQSPLHLESELCGSSNYDQPDEYTVLGSTRLADTQKTTVKTSASKHDFGRSDLDSVQFMCRQVSIEYNSFSFDKSQRQNSAVKNEKLHYASKAELKITDFEILDNISTSFWRKFLTFLKPDEEFSDGARESGSDMVVLSLYGVWPDLYSPHNIEYRMKLYLLPLRLHVDQDALTFFSKFFSFQPAYSPVIVSPNLEVRNPSPVHIPQTFFQICVISGFDLMIDYKPKRVDYGSLQRGQLVELVNFFQLEASEIHLRQLEIRGVHGWGRLWDAITSEWIPHITSTQLPKLFSGVGPIKSLINIGNSVANLIVIPVEQYKKDGRLVYGIKKGAGRFLKGIGVEGTKIGAKLAVGTQVLLENADSLLGTDITQSSPSSASFQQRRYSRYANAPRDINEGFQTALTALSTSLSDTLQTIIAVPALDDDDDDRPDSAAGPSSTAQKIVKAVPIAILKPIMGASEAVKNTMLGLRSTIQPTSRVTMADKYKSPKNTENN